MSKKSTKQSKPSKQTPNNCLTPNDLKNKCNQLQKDLTKIKRQYNNTKQQLQNYDAIYDKNKMNIHSYMHSNRKQLRTVFEDNPAFESFLIDQMRCKTLKNKVCLRFALPVSYDMPKCTHV